LLPDYYTLTGDCFSRLPRESLLATGLNFTELRSFEAIVRKENTIAQTYQNLAGRQTRRSRAYLDDTTTGDDMKYELQTQTARFGFGGIKIYDPTDSYGKVSSASDAESFGDNALKEGYLSATTARDGSANIFIDKRVSGSLPEKTPAWTENGTIHLGPHFFVASPFEKRTMLRHETIHSVHQQIAPHSESFYARDSAEQLAARYEIERTAFPQLNDFFSPVPAILGFPPQSYSPWNQVWIGYPGIVGEVVESGVTVRIFRTYDDLGIKLEGYADYQAFECSDDHGRAATTPIAKKMSEVAKIAAKFNSKIPAAALQRVVLVTIMGDSSGNGYRVVDGKGMMVLSDDDFNAGRHADTIAHEVSHAIFEYHSVRIDPEKRIPDTFALRIADLYSRLSLTKPVPVPKTKFDKKKPPPLVVSEKEPGSPESASSESEPAVPEEGPEPAGIVMVMDTLWSGEGGHPWQGVDEFFASAYAGFIQQPKLLSEIMEYYSKADSKIKKLAKELLDLLELVGQPKKIAKLAMPKDAKAATEELAKISEPPVFTKEKPGIGWLIDPSTMPSPDKIPCP
jgi:hypothetical protein